ncbi:hypothetical protein TNCT_729191 [Trichonephila clavata]|uniref:Uncharacterized protein n=1 Tax=Trichonephila clavata TaxID=2740835 RepID=A0A8X6IFD5_TRICU|nr:hypothetical protein TNCT_729191 [Trichonephila clavata]
MRFDTDQGTKCLKVTWTLSGLVCGIGIDPDVLCIRLVMGESRAVDVRDRTVSMVWKDKVSAFCSVSGLVNGIENVDV